MKTAICAGINNYPGTENDLSGCVNDANGWANLLKSMGFTVRLLIDNQVTADEFSLAIRTALDKSQAGDVVVITYSGHGTQVLDESGDEEDGYDEALYLYDGVFTDDALRELLNGANAGVHVFVITDSCFSGTITRKVGQDALAKPRFVRSQNIPEGAKLVKAFITEENMKEIVLTGCSDTETSSDALIGGKFWGAMTYYALQSFKPGQTYTQFHKILRTKLPTAKYPQSPQLEGNVALKNSIMFEPLSTSSVPPDPIVPDPIPTPAPTPVPPASGGTGCTTVVVAAIILLVAAIVILV
jgi:metacaspase-1